MSNLTLKQCRKLKDWGFPQDESMFYYLQNVGVGEWVIVYVALIPASVIGGELCIACPSLEALLEWGDAQCSEPIDLVWSGSARRPRWSSRGNDKYYGHSYPTRIEAVYALLKEVMR